MKKVVVTKEMIQDYFSRMKDRKFDPNYPFCKLCSTIVFSRGKHISAKSDLKYFQVGELVYEVSYPNGSKGFYHVYCVEHPKRMDQKIMVENIFRYDVDKWDGLEDFVKNLDKKKFTAKQIRKKVMDRFKCGDTTAWRKLRTLETLTH